MDRMLPRGILIVHAAPLFAGVAMAFSWRPASTHSTMVRSSAEKHCFGARPMRKIVDFVARTLAELRALAEVAETPLLPEQTHRTLTD